MPATARLGIPYPSGTTAADGPAQILAMANALDATVPYAQGTLAARPVATTPGKLYYATDTALLYYATGSAWVTVPIQIANLGVTSAKLAADSVDSSKLAADAVGSSEIAADAVTSEEIASGAVGATQIATSLKPSSGAGAGTEALRALGTNSGRAAAGTHASQHNVGGADALNFSTGVGEAAVGHAVFCRDTNLNVNSSTDKVIPWQAAEFSGVSPTSLLGPDTTTVYINGNGWYRISAQVNWADGTVGIRHLWVIKQSLGSGLVPVLLKTYDDIDPSLNPNIRQTVSGVFYLLDEDAIGVVVRATGGDTSLIADGSTVGHEYTPEAPVLHIQYIGA